MQWPQISEVEKLVPLPEGSHGTRLRRSEIPLLIKSIREWYPDVAVGGASCYLTTDFYENEATLEGEVDKPLFVAMFWKGDQFIGFTSWDWEEAPQALYARSASWIPSTALLEWEPSACGSARPWDAW